MKGKDRIGYNMLLLKMKQNLTKELVDESEIKQDYAALDVMLNEISITSSQEEITLYNLMIALKNESLSPAQKVAIIDGAHLFIPYFLDQKQRKDLEIVGLGYKNRYLKMLEAAYPDFYNKAIKKEETEDYLNKLESYLLDCDEIIKTFRNKEGYDDFKENLLKFHNANNCLFGSFFRGFTASNIPEDLVKSIDSCLEFISNLTKTAAKEFEIEKIELEKETRKVEEAKLKAKEARAIEQLAIKEVTPEEAAKNLEEKLKEAELEQELGKNAERLEEELAAISKKEEVAPITEETEAGRFVEEAKERITLKKLSKYIQISVTLLMLFPLLLFSGLLDKYSSSQDLKN